MAEPTLPPYNVGDLDGSIRRRAPAAARNMAPIEAVLRDWLPDSGLVLEIASGTGEHVLHYASAFPNLDWQPSDPDPLALRSIAAWGHEGPKNLRPPIALDASSDTWPIEEADAVLNINMVHISPAKAGIGLLAGASRILPSGGPLILYGPWLEEGVEPVPSNVAFDEDLRRRNPEWGLRVVEDFAKQAIDYGLQLGDRRAMPANNLMLLFRRA